MKAKSSSAKNDEETRKKRLQEECRQEVLGLANALYSPDEDEDDEDVLQRNAQPRRRGKAKKKATPLQEECLLRAELLMKNAQDKAKALQAELDELRARPETKKRKVNVLHDQVLLANSNTCFMQSKPVVIEATWQEKPTLVCNMTSLWRMIYRGICPSFGNCGTDTTNLSKTFETRWPR